jgi:hypothetical protein
MLALIRPFARPRAVLALLATALAAVAFALLGPFAPANASTSTVNVAGTFSFKGSLLVGCPTGSLLCTSGSMNGGVHGNFTMNLISALPAPDPGVQYFTGKLTLTSLAGKLNCTLDGAANFNTTSEGEFGEICVITGGTGTYANAKGDLRMIGTSTSQLLIIPSGTGIYQGTIHK